MAISLNNHESRIKVLENSSASGVFVTPNYSSPTTVSVTASGSYTVPSNGFIILDLMRDGGSGTFIKINNVQYTSGNDRETTEVETKYVFPVIKGDVMSWGNQGVDYGRNGIRFVPCRVTKLYYNLVHLVKGWVM